MKSQFSERAYEQAFSHELAARRAFGPSPIFVPSQVLEEIVGFDAATHPTRRNRVWRILGVSRPPGVHLASVALDREVPEVRLPNRPLSLFLQYKVPDHMVGAAAAQWRLWGRPFYRFDCRGRQHQTLRRLERAIGREAVVRYAAPAFSRLSELERATYRGRVMVRSGFVSPLGLGRHKVWTYVEPGNSGRPNPSGRQRTFESVQDVVSGLNDLASTVDTATGAIESTEGWRDHLRRLGEAARDREPLLRAAVAKWSERIALIDLDDYTEPRLPEVVVQDLRDFASVMSLASKLNASWVLVPRE